MRVAGQGCDSNQNLGPLSVAPSLFRSSRSRSRSWSRSQRTSAMTLRAAVCSDQKIEDRRDSSESAEKSAKCVVNIIRTEREVSVAVEKWARRLELKLDQTAFKIVTALLCSIFAKIRVGVTTQLYYGFVQALARHNDDTVVRGQAAQRLP